MSLGPLDLCCVHWQLSVLRLLQSWAHHGQAQQCFCLSGMLQSLVGAPVCMFAVAAAASAAAVAIAADAASAGAAQ